jgi:hypothetical protein
LTGDEVDLECHVVVEVDLECDLTGDEVDLECDLTGDKVDLECDLLQACSSYEPPAEGVSDLP